MAFPDNGQVPVSSADAANRISPERRRRFMTAGGIIVLAIWIITVALWVKRLHTVPSSIKKTVAEASAPISEPLTEWMEIYLKKDKIGYSERHISPVGEGYLVREEMLLKLNLMGRVSALKAVTQATLGKDFSLQGFHFLLTSGAVRFEAKGNVEHEAIRITIGEGKKGRKTVIPISGPVTISTGVPGLIKGRGLQVGRSFSFSLFDPSVVAQQEATVRVLARESMEIKGVSYAAFRVEGEFLGQKMTFWLDDEGGVLKEEGPIGLTLVRASEAAALGDFEGSGREDIYRLAAVPVKIKLWQPEMLTFIKLRAGGLEGVALDTFALDSGRQSFEGDTIAIKREKVPDPYQLPGRVPDMQEYLKPELGIESDHPLIIKAAAGIVGELQSPVRITVKIMGWVFESIEKMPVMSVPSAIEVLEKRVGDCNEHAVLAAALLRAAGIPARVCVGLVYKDSAFYYHAWNEVYLGSWISMDTVSNQMPADPTHIKLSHGGLDKQASIMGLLGKISLEILAYGYD